MEGLPLSEIPRTPMSCADLEQYQFPFLPEAEGMPSQLGGMASSSATPQMIGARDPGSYVQWPLPYQTYLCRHGLGAW